MKYGLKDYEIETIINYLANYIEIEEAVIFGSRAAGSYKKTSDVDIALKGKNVTPFTAAELKSKIEDETTLPYFFDVVSYSNLTNIGLINKIDSEGIVIYKKL